MKISTFFCFIFIINRYNQYDGMSTCRIYLATLTEWSCVKKTPHRFDCHTHTPQFEYTLRVYVYLSKQKKKKTYRKMRNDMKFCRVRQSLRYWHLWNCFFPLHPPNRFFFSGMWRTSRNNKSKYLSVSVLFILLF